MRSLGALCLGMVVATGVPAPAPLDESKLTPAQQQAIIKRSQNSVGNVTVVPFQNNSKSSLRREPGSKFKKVVAHE